MNKGVIVLGLGLFGGILYYALRPKAKAAGPTVTVDLVPGIQDIVFQGSIRPIKGAFAEIADKVEAVWYYDDISGRWLGYSPTAPDWANDLLVLIKGETYSINAIVACQWTYAL